MNIQCRGGSRSLCKGDKSFEDEEHSGWQSSKLSEPLTTTWEVAQELNVNHSMVIQHLKQIEKVKKLNKWVPCELTKNQTKSLFWSVVFSACAATWTHILLTLPNSNEQYSHIITQPYHGIQSLFNGSDTYLTVWSPEYRVGWVAFNFKYIIFL